MRQHAVPGGARGAEGIWLGKGIKRRLSFGETPISARAPRREDLRVGVILDEFSTTAFAYEWSLVALDPKAWRVQLAKESLDLVFIESAWSGNSRLWRGKLTGPNGPAPEYRDLLQECRNSGVPTVFWNKEDPPHYEDFLSAASCADWVFTSDEGRLEAYRKDLGHERIAVLPFAAQPAVHNPLRPSHGRHARDIAFAGMYFAHKYPERRMQMEYLLGGALDASRSLPLGLEIFSRMLLAGKDYQFPQPLNSRVVGSLSYAQMLTAYKAYKVFLNVNSVIDSSSMCARRIFEITASGTPVVSSPSAAIGGFFNSAEVPVAGTRGEAMQLSRALSKNSELNDRTAHLAQRRIWNEHTYAHRAESVLSAVIPQRSKPVTRPLVSALVSSMRPHQFEHVCRTIGGQTGVDVQLILLAHGPELHSEEVRAMAREYEIADVVLLAEPAKISLGNCLNSCVEAADGRVLAKMDDDDHYGPNYLSDQVFALDYSGADVVGKQAHYMHLTSSNAVLLRNGSAEHRFTDFVAGPTIMASAETMRSLRFEDVRIGEDTAFLRRLIAAGGTVYSADRYNYVQVRRGSGHTWQIDDSELLASCDLKFYGRPNEHVDI
ncbi:glycosyltransferase family protein [Arthrobacter sp. CAN_A1]|uniref:glycosyltransferase family protein n=1 Tax=Arthrobacter sp. CAN_A1 TaxID=2787717 RepID=UPI001A2CD2A9